MFLKIYLFNVHVCLPACTYGSSQKPEEDIGFPGTGDTGSCEVPLGFWNPNSSPLQEQWVLFLPTEPFRQPLLFPFENSFLFMCLCEGAVNMPTEARIWCWIPPVLEFQTIVKTWVLGPKLSGSLEKHEELLIPTLQARLSHI